MEEQARRLLPVARRTVRKLEALLKISQTQSTGFTPRPLGVLLWTAPTLDCGRHTRPNRS
jgi:hypothetical protein